MKLNPKEILFGDDSDRKDPVLLAVTPPRTGERTLLGVENLLQSIAVPEPFSLELAGDMDGVTLMARCLDDQVVRGQMAAHYPQARIRKVDPGDDPLRLGEGEQAWSITLAGRRPRVRPPAHLQGRRPARPRLRPPHRPHGRALGPQRGGARGGAADAALPRPRLVPGPHGQGPQAARHGAEGARLHLPDQAPPDGRHHDGRAGHRGAGRPQGLPVGAGRRGMEGGAVGHGHGPGAGRGRVGVAPLEEGQQAGGRPSAHQGEGLAHRLRRGDTGHGGPARRDGAAARRRAPGAGGRRLPPLRQPRRSAVQGGQGETRRARPVAAPPGRPRAVRQAQRPGSPRGCRPVAPARSGRRDAPGGAVRLKRAHPLGQGNQGRGSGGRHHRGQAHARPLPRRPAQDVTTSTSPAPAWASPPSCTT